MSEGKANILKSIFAPWQPHLITILFLTVFPWDFSVFPDNYQFSSLKKFGVFQVFRFAAILKIQCDKRLAL